MHACRAAPHEHPVIAHATMPLLFRSAKPSPAPPCPSPFDPTAAHAHERTCGALLAHLSRRRHQRIHAGARPCTGLSLRPVLRRVRSLRLARKKLSQHQHRQLMDIDRLLAGRWRRRLQRAVAQRQRAQHLHQHVSLIGSQVQHRRHVVGLDRACGAVRAGARCILLRAAILLARAPLGCAWAP
eukprot:353689-Chlamydomonas_euryale.AAC.5